MSFLSDVLGFEKFALGDMWKTIKRDPERLFVGALDPFSTRMWNKTGIGRDWEPVVDQFGGPYGGNAMGGGNEGVYGRAQAAGVPTGPGGQMHDIARSIASVFAGGYGAGKLPSLGDSGGGMANKIPTWLQNLPNGGMPLGGTGGFAGGGTYPGWPGTPPFNPNAPMPSSAVMPPQMGAARRSPPPWLQKLTGGFDKFMGGMAGPTSPGLSATDQDSQRQRQRMAMLATLLAGSGPAPVGTRGLLQPFGEAIQASQAAGDQFAQDATRAQLIQAQMRQANRPQAVSPGEVLVDESGKPIYENTATTGGNSRYGSPQVTESGRLIALDRSSGRSVYTDTGEPWDAAKDKISADAQLVTLPDGSVQVVNMRREPGTIGTGPRSEEVVSSQIDAAAARAAAETRAKKMAEITAQAEVDLPRAVQQGEQTVATLKSLRDHPGLPYITGWYSKAPVLPGSPQAGAEAIARQVEGTAFLQAYETLKGGGQITQIEGEKAQAAIARLYRAQSTEDYQSALDDLIEVIEAGVSRARTKAGQGASQSDADMPDFTNMSDEELRRLVGGNQ